MLLAVSLAMPNKKGQGIQARLSNDLARWKQSSLQAHKQRELQKLDCKMPTTAILHLRRKGIAALRNWTLQTPTANLGMQKKLLCYSWGTRQIVCIINLLNSPWFLGWIIPIKFPYFRVRLRNASWNLWIRRPGEPLKVCKLTCHTPNGGDSADLSRSFVWTSRGRLPVTDISWNLGPSTSLAVSHDFAPVNHRLLRSRGPQALASCPISAVGHFASDFGARSTTADQLLTQHVVTTDNCERCRKVASCHSHLDHADPLTSENAAGVTRGPTGKLGWGHHLERSRRPLRLGDRESRPPLAKQGDCIFDHQMLPNAFGNKKTHVFH